MRGALALTILCAFAGDLSAQSNSFTGGLATTTGMSDNINLAPEPESAMPGQEIAIKDGFTTITPSLTFTRDNRTSIYQLVYSFNAQLYFENSEANSYTNQLGLQSEFLLTPLSRLRLGVSGIQGETNNFAVVAPGQAVQAGQPGGTSFLFLIGSQGYSREMSREWRFDQNLAVQTFVPVQGGSTDTVDTNNIMAWTRTYLRSALVYSVRSQYFVVFGEDGQHQVLFGPTLGWRRDFLRSWNVETTLGVIGVTSPDNFSQTGVTVEPVGQLALRYRYGRSDLILSFLHDAQPNLQVGEFFINDAVNLTANYILFQEPTVTLRGLVGGQRARELSVTDNSIGSSSYAVLADAGVAWQIQPSLELAARYVHQRQDADPNSSLLSFTSNTGMITLAGRYPGGQQRRQPSLRRSYRVDQSDVDDPFAERAPPKKPSGGGKSR